MKSRTKGRARALQVLYAWEMRGGHEPLREVDRHLRETERESPDPEIRRYATRLLDIVQENRHEIDARIDSLSDNWRLSRMTVIDRNILRLAAAEMLYVEGIPLRVSVHEAIRLADWFGTADSRRFINGVLDALLHQLTPEHLGDAR